MCECGMEAKAGDISCPRCGSLTEGYYVHEKGCDCAVCNDIAFRRSLRGKPYTEPAAMELLRQKLQAKHDANCLLRLMLETLPIQLEQHKLTHDRTACAMLIQDSIDYLFRDGENTLIESPSNDEQQMLKMAYMMGQTTEQKLSEHLSATLAVTRGEVDKWREWHDSACKDAIRWREDAQELHGQVVELKEHVKQLEDSCRRYKEALACIAYRGISGLSWQADYERDVNVAKEALADRP